MQRLLLTWSDRGVDGPAPAHQAKRPTADLGPVLRLLKEAETRYDRAIILTVPRGVRLARGLADEMKEHSGEVEVRPIELDDPSDYAALFKQLAPFASDIAQSFPSAKWQVDVLLSAGTPQAQTIWVILVQASILRARLLQVIPAAFVPVPHPRAVREVSLDIDGFPEIRVLREEVSRLRAEVRARGSKLIAGSESMRDLMDRVVRVSRSDLPVLVFGETGSGKELIARAIHDGSHRAAAPFVAENCVRSPRESSRASSSVMKRMPSPEQTLDIEVCSSRRTVERSFSTKWESFPCQSKRCCFASWKRACFDASEARSRSKSMSASWLPPTATSDEWFATGHFAKTSTIDSAERHFTSLPYGSG